MKRLIHTIRRKLGYLPPGYEILFDEVHADWILVKKEDQRGGGYIVPCEWHYDEWTLMKIAWERHDNENLK